MCNTMNRPIFVLFVLLALYHMFLPTSAIRNTRVFGGNKYSINQSNKNSAPKTFVGTSSGIPAQNVTRRGLGISAWGIIAVIITSILTGLGLYYFTMCYPILCKKQRKYDMIGLPSVA